MKIEKKSDVSAQPSPAPGACLNRPLLCTTILLAAFFTLLFWRDFSPTLVPFSNDGPYGAMVAEQNRMPSIMDGFWANLNWLGNEGLSPSPSITSAMRLVTSPLIYAKVLCPASLLIAGICAAFCFRQLRLAPMACVLGGLAAALNSDFFSTACWGVSSQIVGFGAMYVALGLISSPGTKKLWIKTILAGFAVGVGVMEAYDIGALFSLMIAAYVVYHALFLRARETAAWEKIGVGFLRIALVAACAGFIAIRALSGLVGTQITGVVGTEQDEPTKLAHFDADTTWSLPKIETLQVLIPGVFGFRDDWYMYENDRPIEDQYWGDIGNQPGLQRMTGTGLYAGVLVVMIAVWAILQSFRRSDSPFTIVQRRALWFWSVVLLVTALLSYGKFAPFYRYFYALPYASTIRSPTKFMHLFSWALVIIFAYGAHGLSAGYLQKAAAQIEGGRTRFKTWLATASAFERSWLLGCVIAIVLGIIGWFVYGRDLPRLTAYLQTVGISPDNAPGVAKFSVRSICWFVFLLVLSSGLLAAIFSGQFPGARAKWGGILLGALLLFDLGRADAPWISYWNTDYKYAIDPIIQLLADKPYEHRVAMLPVPLSNQQLGLLQNAYNIDWKQHLFQYKNIQCTDVVQEPRVAVDKDQFLQALHLSPPRSLPDMLRFWELSNTRYILGPGGDFMSHLDPSGQHFRVIQAFDFVPKQATPGDWPEDYAAQPNTNGQLAVIEYLDALPRAKLFSVWQAGVSDAQALEILPNPAFDPHQAVIISENIPAAAAAAANLHQDAGVVEINPNYKSKRIQLSADVKVPAILMLSERYNANWKVEVDGQPAPLLRCDFILRGVALQPGKHDVVFRFAPPAKTLYLSCLAILIGFGLAGFLIFDKSPDETEDEADKSAPSSAPPSPAQPEPKSKKK